MTGFCRQWVPEYARLVQPLQDMAYGQKLASHDRVVWTPEGDDSFTSLKQALTTSPTLGLPDPKKKFIQAVCEKDGYMSSVLMQKHGDKLRPIAYFSSKLDAVAQGLPYCLKAVAAAADAVLRSRPLVCYQPLELRVPHSVASILLEHKTSHLSGARFLHYHNILLSLPHLTVVRSPVLNPATFLPTEVDGEPHDCLAAINQQCTPRDDLSDVPLPNCDLVFYVDGSASKSPISTVNHVGYAIVTDHDVIEGHRLPHHLSAQAAELFALTRACILAESLSVTIYTDSRYAFGVVHDFGTLWKMRGFITSTGTQIQHGQLIRNLLEAVLLPREVAICKCEAHTTGRDVVSLGNRRADAAAKAAAQAPPHSALQMTHLTPTVSLSDLVEVQSQASPKERTAWRKAGASYVEML
ncbi:uncharacterized protein LOC117593887 [Esox lucius]|uniref:uncharacterized protein LOC117593887 n=1 Tax=Esox lucius TaxID=8010 RepID=UPI0014773938|nr:uncharacterized protein LOC117593887 [Esox lucius]